jgi:hypothetical protein
VNRNIASAVGLFAAALLIVISRPAAAAVTAQFNTVGPTKITAPCPVNVSFTGSITGPAGPVTYHYSHFTGGVWTYSSDVTAPIPSNGSLTINETLTIDAAHAGLQSNQVDTTVPNASEGKVFFTVTCANPYTVLHQGSTLVRPVITLHSKGWLWRKYEYKWVGMSAYQPETGLGPCADLCTGWSHIKNGDSFWLFHWNYYLRSMLLFDQSAIAGAHPTKATLTLKINSGNWSDFGGIGRAPVSWIGGSNDFTAPYPFDGDFSAPVSWQVNGGNVNFDVTSIVQGWASGASANNGFVLRGKNEDNGSNGNDSGGVDFGNDGVLTITQ